MPAKEAPKVVDEAAESGLTGKKAYEVTYSDGTTAKINFTNYSPLNELGVYGFYDAKTGEVVILHPIGGTYRYLIRRIFVGKNPGDLSDFVGQSS